MREAFAVLTFFQLKTLAKSGIIVWNFNETLTHNIVSFEQPGPDLHNLIYFCDLNAL